MTEKAENTLQYPKKAKFLVENSTKFSKIHNTFTKKWYNIPG